MDELIGMGFCNRKLNEELLNKYPNNINAVLTELLDTLHDDWATRRH